MPRFGRLITNSALHRFIVRRRGKKDGELGYPGENDPKLSEYENQLGARGQQHLNQIQGAGTKQLQRLEGHYNALIDRLRVLLTERDKQRAAFDAKKATLGREPVVHLSPLVYLFFMLLIAGGELALNFQAFQVFRKSLLLTFVMSLAVAVGLPASAHFIGVIIRQRPKPLWQSVAVGIGAGVLGIACVFGINIARSAHLAEEQQIARSEAAQEVADAQLKGLAGSPGQVSGVGGDRRSNRADPPDAMDVVLEHAFVMINLFVFATAIVLAYFAHEEDQDFENTRVRLLRIKREGDQAVESIEKLDGEIDALRTKIEAEADEIGQIIRELNSMYRAANQRARPSSAVKSFAMPAELPRLHALPERAPQVARHVVDDLITRWTGA